MYRRSLAEVDAFLAEIAESRPAGIDFHAFSSTVEMTCSGYILLVFGTQKAGEGGGLIYDRYLEVQVLQSTHDNTIDSFISRDILISL